MKILVGNDTAAARNAQRQWSGLDYMSVDGNIVYNVAGCYNDCITVKGQYRETILELLLAGF